MKNTKLFLSILIIALIVVGAFFVFSPKQEETKVVKIGYLQNIGALSLYVAQENNYFTEQGVQIETIQLQSSNQLTDALVKGEIDVIAQASVIPAFIIETIEPGKIKIFSASDITPKTPFDSLIVRQDSSISSLKGLEGKKIGVFPGSSATLLLKKFLIDKDIDISKIEFIQIIQQNHLPALYSGSIDALHAFEPDVTFGLQTGEARKIYGSVLADLQNNNPASVALISTKFISENPSLAKKTVEAFSQASNFIKENDVKTREIVIKYLKLDKDVADKVTLLYLSGSDAINAEALQSYADLIYDIGEMKNKIDVSTLLYNS